MRVTAFALVLTAATAYAQPAPKPDPTTTATNPDEALAKLVGRIDALAREVAALRGLSLKKPVPHEVIDRDELRRRLVEMSAEETTRTESAAEALALARWGLIPLATNYEALLIDLLTEQIAGYYDPDTKQLTISKSAGKDADWAELVLAHELEHAIQDQHFDLKKLEDIPTTEADASLARRSLVEGDGVAVMIELMLKRTGIRIPWSNPDLAAAVESAMVAPGTDGIDKAPLAIRESLLFPYRAGFTFVAALRRRSPWSAVDAAFARPPKSTEQILHPEKYVADEAPVAVAIAAPPSLATLGYAIAHSTTWGELGIQLVLRSKGLDLDGAALAAAGWSGDRAIVLARATAQTPRRSIGVARMEWDSEVDALEATEAFVKAIDRTTLGAVVSHEAMRTQWFALDGTVSWVERRERSLVVAIGVPAPHARILTDEIWTASTLVP